MPKEKWLIDPSELDEFQKKVYDLSLDDSYIIKGCAGSGKTILALYRARDINIRYKAAGEIPSFTVLVFTKALRSFIHSGITQLGIDLHQVIHWEQWDGSEVDYMIVDECQDFTAEKMEQIIGAKVKSVMLYGDTQQQLYTSRLSLEDISKIHSIPQKELSKNYRLPKSIADFASYLSADKKLGDKCMKPGLEKPRILKFNTWQKELDWIKNEIKTRNYTDVAILAPFNNKTKAQKSNQGFRNVESIKEYFDNNNLICEAKMWENAQNEDEFDNDNNDLDFESELPKIMTFHSAKGLQFETVFIPFCYYPIHDKWLVKFLKNPLYVGITRSYKNLYITHSGELTSFFDSIPADKYSKL